MKNTIPLLFLFSLVQAPFDLAVAQLPPLTTGQFYVSSYTGDEVVVYDSTGAYNRSFSAPGLDGPGSIVFAPQ